MQTIVSLFRRKIPLAVVFASILLVGYIGFLLGTNYLAQKELQEYALDQLRQEMEKRAIAVSYFYEERKYDLKNLAKSLPLATFFENKSLGMSMEYGLLSSLLTVSHQFQRFLDEKVVGTHRMYSRILFIDPHGDVLIDTGEGHPALDPKSVRERYLTPENPDVTIIPECDRQTLETIVSIPYFFKEAYKGQILAWILPATIDDHFIKSDGVENQVRGIVCPLGHIHTAGPFPFSGLPDLITMEMENPQRFEVIDKHGTGVEMLAVQFPIKGTPFSFLNMLPTSKVLGATSPRQLLLVMGSLALIVLAGTTIVWRTDIRNNVLQAHLEEIEKRERAIQAKNRVLKKEIIERKRVEEALRQAKEEAEAANRTKSEFLANMSHELRTPLNHIMGFTELVVDQHFGELNPMQTEYLGDVLSSSNHLLSLINDILDLSKIETKNLELELTEVHLQKLLNHSLVVIKEEAMKHRLQVVTEIHNIPDIMVADERKLKQILYNLLSNAVKFTPEGGSIRLLAKQVVGSELPGTGGAHLTPRPPHLVPPHLPLVPGDAIEISVTDTGIGMKREDLERIFHPFEQAEHSKSRKYQGTGLGLSLTKSFVELHGGWIWAESEGEGKGSSVTCILPLQECDDLPHGVSRTLFKE